MHGWKTENAVGAFTLSDHDVLGAFLPPAEAVGHDHAGPVLHPVVQETAQRQQVGMSSLIHVVEVQVKGLVPDVDVLAIRN